MENFLNLIKGEKSIVAIVIIGICLRLLFGQVFNPLSDEDQYWEYGILAKNIKAGKGYSFLYFENGQAAYSYKEDSHPLPSAYMPPAYVFFLYPFLSIDVVATRNLLIGLVQSVLAGFVILLIYFYTRQLFNKQTALLAAALTAFLPEFIYLPFTIGPSIHYHLLVLLYFFILKSSKGKFAMIALAFTGGLLVYFRSEFILFLLLLAFMYSLKKEWKKIVYVLAIPCLILLPWTIRNWLVFERFVPLTTNSGLNFYRGHNPKPGSWIGAMEDYHPEIPATVTYEIELNYTFLKKGLDFIVENPVWDAANECKKLFGFWTIDLSDARSKNPLYWIPWLIVLVASLCGLIQAFNLKKFLFEYLFFFYSSLVVILFFSQLRYQSLMKIMLVPFAAHAVVLIYQKISKKKLKITARS